MKYSEFVEQLAEIFRGSDETTSTTEIEVCRIIRQFQEQVAHPHLLPATPENVLKVFRDAWNGEPEPYNPAWESAKEPGWNDPELESIEGQVARGLRGLYFVAVEFHSMADNVLNDPYRGFGVDSPSGKRWYNFDLHTMLHAYHQWDFPVPGEDPEEEDIDEIAWDYIADVLIIGSAYE